MNQSIISPLQRENYSRDGFLVLKDFIEENVCDLLISQANKLIDEFDHSKNRHIFAAKNNDQYQLRNQYFMESAHQISFFFEENAFDANQNLKYEKSKAINKIGHALHDLDPVFNCFSRTHKIARLVNELDLQNPLLLQSMYICKQPHIGGEVNCHQDKTYLYTEGEPVMGLWFALEDATLENGCLWAIPGGHHYDIKSKMVRDENGILKHETYDAGPWDLNQMVPLEVTRGSLVVLHGQLPHMSKENISSKSRHAFTLHIISRDAIYPKTNWLLRPDNMPLRGF